MKVSDRTTNLLKNYANINQSIEFREGKLLKTVSPLNTILASVEIEEEFPQTFPIYELNRFLGTLSLFNDPELNFDENGVSITDDKHSAIYRYCGSSSMFQTPPDKDITFPDAEVEFTLEKDVFKSSDQFSTKVGSTDKTFSMIFKTENLNKILEGTYDVSLSSKRISHFKREGDSLQYWIALEQNSTFEE